jgi:uncharacterized protein
MIVELVRNGLKVGITAVSHKVISKLLEETCTAAREEGVNLQAIQKGDGGDGCDDEIVTRAKNNEAVANALRDDEAQVAAGLCGYGLVRSWPMPLTCCSWMKPVRCH